MHIMEMPKLICLDCHSTLYIDVIAIPVNAASVTVYCARCEQEGQIPVKIHEAQGIRAGEAPAP